jgi:hypothetical protein
MEEAEGLLLNFFPRLMPTRGDSLLHKGVLMLEQKEFGVLFPNQK